LAQVCFADNKIKRPIELAELRNCSDQY